jgi:meso-butanediol dehydrogenase/(S,S)-butanediol dehydrogenase/diacetyl reductase
VTGAASGIGAAVVDAVAGAGDRVIAVDRDPTVLEPRDHVDLVHAFVADAAIADGVAEVMAFVMQRFGRLDGFVANAGIAGIGRAEDVEPGEWDRVMAVNARSVYLAARFAIPLMRASGGGSFVAVASQLGLVGGANMVTYCASKGAVVNLVRALAIDHSAEGIRVNCVCPGPTLTPMLASSWERTGPHSRASSLAAVPLARAADPAEIASVIQFLLSPAASFVAGAVWTADGGYTAS